MTARIGRAPRAPGLLRIGDASRAVGVSPSTLRLWEGQGLVAPLRPAGGERRYGPDELTRLRCIRRLRTVEGLNAAGIRRALGSDDVETVRSVPAAAHGPAAADGPAAARGAPAGRDPAEGDHAAAVLVGARLRAMRTATGLSLRAVAARTGLSASFLSGLERGVSSASVAALVRLAMTYQTTVAAIVHGPAAGVPGPGAAAAGAAPDAAFSGPGAAAASDRVVRDGARPALETGRGVRIEELAMLPTRLRPQLVVLAPGATSEGTYTHAGEEFMYVLEGRVAVWLDEREHHELGPGDALTFPSSLPHRFVALGAGETRILWVNTPPTS